MLEFSVITNKSVEVLDITKQVVNMIPPDYNGFFLLFCPHSTAAIVVAEWEENLIDDYEKVFGQYLADQRPFKHCRHDVPNAEAHILSAMHGVAVPLPVEKGELKLGKWQSLLFVELDGPRDRKVRLFL